MFFSFSLLVAGLGVFLKEYYNLDSVFLFNLEHNFGKRLPLNGVEKIKIK